MTNNNITHKSNFKSSPTGGVEGAAAHSGVEGAVAHSGIEGASGTSTGIFVGSFDPFTVGHDAIVRRALPLFDRIVIGVGLNERKKYMYSPDVRLEAIRRIYNGEPKIEVKMYSDLTVDFARREHAAFIIKGVRSIKDFEYEREQADINRKIGGIDTILFYAEPQYESVSSSMVRELKHFGKDASEFIPNSLSPTLSRGEGV